jgi:hypothetical protein
VRKSLRRLAACRDLGTGRIFLRETHVKKEISGESGPVGVRIWPIDRRQIGILDLKHAGPIFRRKSNLVAMHRRDLRAAILKVCGDASLAPRQRWSALALAPGGFG